MERNMNTQSVTPLLFVLAVLGWAQSPTPTGGTVFSVRPAPTSTVYAQLFRHVLFLERQANLADQQGQNGQALRDFYQNRAHLTSAEAAALKQIASDTQTAMDAVNQQIHDMVQQFRASVPGGVLTSKDAMPAPPPALQGLQDKKNAIASTQLAALQTALGVDRFQKLDNYVQKEFAPHVFVSKVQRPSPGVPNKQLPSLN